MRFLVALLLTIFCNWTIGQTTVTDSTLYKWLKACVHIEGRPGYENELRKLRDSMDEGKITFERYSLRYDQLREISIVYPATAIYLRYNKKNYLLSAGHVIEDTSSYNEYFGPQAFHSIALINSVRDVPNFGVPRDLTLLTHLNAGTPDFHPYIIWKERDLSLIDLSQTVGKYFDSSLRKRGYVPIELTDLDTNCNISPGDMVKAIGYASDLSIIDQRAPNTFRPYWESSLISVPIVSSGSVSFVRENDFSADIFIYRGNSGGPIIKKGKLVGIVSSFYSVAKKQGEIDYFERHTGLIKSSFIMSLIRSYEKKISKYSR